MSEPISARSVLAELVELADTDIDDTDEWVLRVLDVVEHARTVLAGEVEPRTEELPKPDRFVTDDGANAPGWDGLSSGADFIEVWPDGVNTGAGFIDAADITPEQVEREGFALLAAAWWMRKSDGWRPVPTPEGGQR